MASLNSPASITPPDFSKTLLILPCSGAKRRVGQDVQSGPAITESLPNELADELLQARTRVKQLVPFDETVLLPAWQRYNGALYKAGRQAIGDLMQAGAHVLILSGGYGAVRATEAIGHYEARLTLSWWPAHILQRVLITYAQHNAISAVRVCGFGNRAICPSSAAGAVAGAGIDDAVLLTPEARPGGLSRSPATQGQVLAALRDGTLTSEWQSSLGLGLQIRSV